MTITQRLYAIGCMLFLWYASLVIAPQLLLLLGIPISAWQFWACFGAFLAASWVFHRNYFGINKLSGFGLNLGICILFFGICLYLSKMVFDSTFEGTWYHMDAVYLLEGGWIPSRHILIASETSNSQNLLNQQPIGSWVFGAIIYTFTGEVEMGKAMNLQLILSTLLVAQHLGRSVFKLSSFISWLLALLVATNPIQILNIFSFNPDAQVSALSFLGLAFAIYQAKEGGWLKGFLALLSFSLLANISRNGAIFSLIGAISFLGFLFYTHAYKWQKIVKIGLLWFVFTYGILGWSPFVSNIYRPVESAQTLSNGAMNAQEQIPANFIDRNRFVKFFLSFYAEPNKVSHTQESNFKTLFSPVSPSIYEKGNTRLAGFGPFAAEVFTFLFPLGLFVLLRKRGNEKRINVVFLFIIFLSIFIHPDAWILRFVPQFWLVFLMFLLLLINEPQWQGPAFVLSIALLLNNLLLLNVYAEASFSNTRELTKQVKLVKENYSTFLYSGGGARAWQNRLDDMGLPNANQAIFSEKDSSTILFSGSHDAYFMKSPKK